MSQEDIQKALEALGKSGITVNGDLVLEKHVENEIGNVEAGGIGIQINQGVERKPLTTTDEDIRTTIQELMKAKNQEDKPVFRNKKQWWAVQRVLMYFCNYPSQMTAFVSKMKELGVDKVDGKRDLSYESLSAAGKEVPLMATCSPATWSALQNRSDDYRQQYDIADFLMKKMGIKS